MWVLLCIVHPARKLKETMTCLIRHHDHEGDRSHDEPTAGRGCCVDAKSITEGWRGNLSGSRRTELTRERTSCQTKR